MKTFDDYRLDRDIKKAIDKLGFETPTQVQQDLFPLLLENKDTIVKSQTGSGKTAAFAIPILQMIAWDQLKPQVLVLTPTRELALQVKEDMFHIGRFKRVKVVSVFGKSSFEGQAKQLKQRTHVVVGTPGRIMDHMQNGTLDVSQVRFLVIDEADEMFSMGFEEQMRLILKGLTTAHTTTLLSATITSDIERLCKRYMKNPQFIDVKNQYDVSDIIQQTYCECEDKAKALYNVMVLENPDSCIIFCNTQVQVDEVYEQFFKENRIGKKLHGGMEQKDRIHVINDFKHGYFRYLVATDVVARGLDIEKVELIINYDVPDNVDTYIHRIGRTGRIHQAGMAITLVDKASNYAFSKLEQQYEKPIMEQTLDDDLVKQKEAVFLETNKKQKPIRQTTDAVFKDEIMKLHINAGKKTKMRALDIVGALCSIPDVTQEDIGVISIVDVSTFVEILNNKGELVYQALQEKPIKGRIRKVHKANLSVYEQDYQNQQK